MSALRRNNVIVSGQGSRTVMFSSGFGTDQTAWRKVVPAFDDCRVVLFDHVGAAGSDLSAYDGERYASLHGYAHDLVEILAELDDRPVIFVGHSVAAMIGMLAAIDVPDRFASLVMVCPSPHYIDAPDYVGGFSRADLDELLEVVDSNFLGWSRDTAPAIMGNPERPELAAELGSSFIRTDPVIARQFARVTFLSDHRADLPHCHTSTLVLQSRGDLVAPQEVGSYVTRQMPHAELYLMNATGHCPHMSAPGETITAIRHFIGA